MWLYPSPGAGSQESIAMRGSQEALEAVTR